MASASIIFALICVSDYFDGPLARRLGRESLAGKVFDNVADLCFLLSSLIYLVYRGTLPPWVPLAVAGAFAQYALDSYLLSRSKGRPALFANPAGHWAGVLNYSLVGLFSLHLVTGHRLLPYPLPRILTALWLGYLLVAMCARARFFLRSYTAERRP